MHGCVCVHIYAERVLIRVHACAFICVLMHLYVPNTKQGQARSIYAFILGSLFMYMRAYGFVLMHRCYSCVGVYLTVLSRLDKWKYSCIRSFTMSASGTLYI